MTILMLDELSKKQLQKLEALVGESQTLSNSAPEATPWTPKRQSNKVGVEPWWQRHRSDQDESAPIRDPLWRPAER